MTNASVRDTYVPELPHRCSRLTSGLKPRSRHKRHVGAVDEVVCRQRHDMVREVLGDDVLLRDAGHVGRAAQPHHHHQLILQHVHHAHDALVPVRGQRVEHRPAHADAGGAERHGLEDVRATADAAIHEYGKSLPCGARLAQGLHNFWQHLDARAAGVELPAAVVGEHAASEPGLVGHHCVLSALHALQEHLHLGDAFQPRHIVPAKARVDVTADRPRGTLRAVHLTGVLVVTLHVRALLRELVPHVLLPAAELGRIHCHEKCLHARVLELLHVLLRPRALRVHVQLREELLPGQARLKHLVERVGTQRGQHVWHPSLVRGAHDAHLAVGMRELRQRRRCEVERQRRGRAEEARGHVNLPHVH
mmetsp:Transcript_30059/g.75696  ORF Transcript_30059/g.75696 Transcript_30059/m.75696 type:complete len:363 (-) Transcript_30059:271-1359(-)